MLLISKDKSFLLKGVVIIMMVFLHLFNGNHTDLCINLLYVGDEPLAKWLSHACGPVGFFLLFSGYGIAYTYDKKGVTFLQQFRRILKLYIHYWIVLAVFLSIGWYMYPARYPDSWSRLLLNMTGWKTDYNFEMWFLFPYSLVSLTSRYIIRCIEKSGILFSVIVTAVINFGACYVISRYYSTFLKDYPLVSLMVVYLQFLYPFTVGVAFYRSRFQLNRQLPTWLVLMIMILLVALVATIDISVTYILYVPLLVYLLCHIRYPNWMKNVLMELGRKSMPIWMIHTWYCNYLFQEQVYSLKYPVFILGGVIVISYLTSIPVLWTAKKCITALKI